MQWRFLLKRFWVETQYFVSLFNKLRLSHKYENSLFFFDLFGQVAENVFV